jgi:hypothetical protein
LFRSQFFIQHQLSAPDINLLAEIAQGIIKQRLFIGPEALKLIQG